MQSFSFVCLGPYICYILQKSG